MWAGMARVYRTSWGRDAIVDWMVVSAWALVSWGAWVLELIS